MTPGNDKYSHKGKVYVWMRVTEDKYSLPIVIADTGEELARKCEVKLNTIHRYISLFESGVKKGYPKYVRVILREEELMDKFNIAKRKLAKIPEVYEQLMRLHPDGMPSLGMVARWDRVGGFSGGCGSITETTAMKGLTLNEEQQEMLKWVDAAYAVFFQLLDEADKNGPKRLHDRVMASVLNKRVFDGWKFEDIKTAYFRPQISVQYVRRVYDQCVELIVQEADRQGLFKRFEGA